MFIIEAGKDMTYEVILEGSIEFDVSVHLGDAAKYTTYTRKHGVIEFLFKTPADLTRTDT
jgi:hypothetical protein